jgi:hypothetical protein
MDKATATLDWSFKGMKTLVLENKLLKVSVLLDKGSDIFEIKYKPLDLDLMWHSPTGYRKPSGYIDSLATGDGAFFDFYGGGWNDIFPNFGLSSGNRGARWGLHGESSLLPWACRVSSPQHEREARAELSTECIRYPLRARKSIILHGAESTISLSEDIFNVGAQSVELSWAQHIAFGEPFIGSNLGIDIPAVKARTMASGLSQERLARDREFDWPFAPGASGDQIDLRKIPDSAQRAQDDVVITQLREPKFRLLNEEYGLGVEVTWNPETFRFLWYWINWGALDYPWFGRGRALALEPVTSTEGGGLADQVRAGTALNLAPGTNVHGELSMRVLT